jgi:hypothetical protein
MTNRKYGSTWPTFGFNHLSYLETLESVTFTRFETSCSPTRDAETTSVIARRVAYNT